MRRLLIAGAMLMTLSPASAGAWGFEAHRFIMGRAIALLPAALRPVFERDRAMLVERSIDPDTWRTAGFDGEAGRHFLNVDWVGYGRYPFAGLPRDYAAAIAKFGRTRVDENGTLPWRVEEYYAHLRRAFASAVRRGPAGRFEVLFFSAALAHYVADAHVPFHAVTNYDGQLTGQQGIHARFESSLFERYQGDWVIAPPALAPVRAPRDFIFDRIIEGAPLVPAILDSDRHARGPRAEYGAAYYAAMFTATRAVLERRLGEAIAATAAMIAGAWEAAGRPDLTLAAAASPQPRRP